MSKDRIRSILEAAGVEAAQRRPVPEAEVVAFPLRSRFLDRTSVPLPAPEPEPEPEGIEVHPGIWWAIRVGKYLGFACVVLIVLMVYSWTRTTLVLSDVGGKACAAGPINIPAYTCEVGAVDCFTVPQEAIVSGVKEQAFTRNMALVGCADAGRLF
jgi:hypothetical protein